jgi:MFS family permease
MNAGQFGFVTSIYTLGGLVGALSGGMCSTRYGRLQTMRGTTLLFIAGSVLQTLAPNMALFAVGRTIAGLGAGAAIVVVPVYISEVAPPAEKGLFGALTQVAISFGIVVTQTLGLFLSSTRSQRWRGILAVGVGLGLLHLLGLFGVVESPKWLCSRDQRAGGSAQTAKRYLKRIRPAGWDVDGEMASWEAGDTGNDDGIWPFLFFCGTEQKQAMHRNSRYLPSQTGYFVSNRKREN